MKDEIVMLRLLFLLSSSAFIGGVVALTCQEAARQRDDAQGRMAERVRLLEPLRALSSSLNCASNEHQTLDPKAMVRDTSPEKPSSATH